MCFVPAIAKNSDFYFVYLAWGCNKDIFHNDFFHNELNKRSDFFSWKFNERQRSTNDTNLAGFFFATKLFSQRIKQKKRIFFLEFQWTPAFNEWHKFSKAFFYAHESATAHSPEYCTIVDAESKDGLKTHQAYNHGIAHQLMLRAKTGWKFNRRVIMASYNSWYWEQRRAESPIRIQPRAAPWVKMFQQACALKEQKEGTNEHFAGSCCAYSAPIS